MAGPAAGDAGAAPGQGAPAATVQPGAPGQGQAPGQPTAGKGAADAGAFDWNLFPDVPEDQRELLQPHLRNVQGHVTRLEQQYAPYKGLVDTLDPAQVSNLVGFLQQFNQDPVTTWLGMAQDLQQNGALPATVDMAQLQAMIQGTPQTQAQPGEEIPAWAQELQQRVQGFEQRTQAQVQQEEQQRMEAENAEVLSTAKTNIRGTLTQAGIGEDLVDDNMIVAAIIASDGDEQMAAQSLAGLRDRFLASFTQQNGGGPKPPAVAGNLAQPQQKGRSRGDGFDGARTGARQFLEQKQAAAAQE